MMKTPASLLAKLDDDKDERESETLEDSGRDYGGAADDKQAEVDSAISRG
jgi:hypothetical protein